MTTIEKRLFKTIIYTLLYCIIWQVLELIIYGQVEPRDVDTIMMMLFMPMIWKGVK